MRPNAGSFPFTDENGTVWLAFMDFGERSRDRVVVCVHGLTRNGRDFDRLAVAMAKDFRVIEVDVAARGRAGWLAGKQPFGIQIRSGAQRVGERVVWRLHHWGGP